jgi:hypothetical protein
MFMADDIKDLLLCSWPKAVARAYHDVISLVRS